MTRRLTADDVQAPCDPRSFDVASTADLPAPDGVLGQERALEAIAFGVGMKAGGYNLFAVGAPATGKASMLKEVISRAAASEPTPNDWCYVTDFADPYRPRALALPAGRGRDLREVVARAVAESAARLTRTFEGEEYERRTTALTEEADKRADAAVARIAEAAGRVGFTVSRGPEGIVLMPVIDGRPIPPEQFAQLSEEDRAGLEARAGRLQSDIEPAARQLRQIEREAEDAAARLLRDTAAQLLATVWGDVRRRFADLPRVCDFLSALEADLAENAAGFLPDEDDEEQTPGADGQLVDAALAKQRFLDRFRVHVIVDRTGHRGAPVVVEPDPTYARLFGRIERRVEQGNLVADIALLKPGALHAANGGYLIVDARDLLEDEHAFPALKKALKSGLLRIEDPEENRGPIASLAPDAIPLNVKVVLFGPPTIYYPLAAADEELRELFKVKVDFAESLPRTPETELQLARFVGKACRDHGLRHLTRAAVARLVEYTARAVPHQARLSARLGDIVDLLREADFEAARRRAGLVDAEDLERALANRVRRTNLLEEELARRTREGEVLLDTTGSVVGQVNGIAVLSTGDYQFGRPTRITARAHAGKPGVVDVEREAGLGGAIHSKGVMLVTGYLAGRYARGHRLGMSAWLAFEQNYDEIDGDSASVAEVCALLSAIAEVPLWQGWAITGSMNQLGQIQPVGGINEKIEGFFAFCKERGLDGRQGVVIPETNARHLVLRREVTDAVRAGLFQIVAASTVDEALAVLSGREAGVRGADGRFAPGTVNALVDDALVAWGRSVRDD